MKPEREGFWHWPTVEVWRWAFTVGIPFALWFALIYGGAWYITDLHSYRIPVHMEWEQHIPFWPASVVVYESMMIILHLPLFVLRSQREFHAFAFTLAVVVFVAGVCFVLIPAEVAYDPIPHDLGVWTWPVQTAMKLNLGTYNMAPSLHVALAVCCAGIMGTRAGPTGKAILGVWAFAIALSTLFLHQHHVVDVVTGGPLGWLGKRLVYDRWLQIAFPSPAADPAPPV